MPQLRFEHGPVLIGVVHLAPLPGSPRGGAGPSSWLSAALRDARALARGGCDALLVENFGDVPFYPASVPPETVACMARVLGEVRAAHPKLPLGVNVLRNDARSALGLCAAFDLEFLRVNVHAGAAVSDQGILEGRAHETLRERARLCPRAAILADVHVKHATPLAQESLAEATAELVGRALADAVIVSGRATGSPPSARSVAEVASAAGRAPVLIGSGLDLRNAESLLGECSGAIVGTALKRGGRVRARVDEARVRAFATLLRRLARERVS
ncbi:MAG: BtpA/SgcQ family protein [Planctomycetes bacterium]|nr:BtpA/SgcQ family protein [Planctomycetota bacterium]